MTAHQSSSTSRAKPFPTQSSTHETSPFRQPAGECVTDLGMVALERLSEEPNKEEIRIEEWSEDVSYTSSKDPDDEDCQSEVGQELATDECVGSFGNIVVKNSSDVQFGNNTYYQGPVTIKQFVYKGADSDKNLAIGNGERENFGYLPDDIIHADEIQVTNNDNKSVNKDINYGGEVTNRGAHYLENLYKKQKLIVSICLTSVLTVLLIVLIVVLTHKSTYVIKPGENPGNSDEPDKEQPIPPPSVNNTISGKLHMVPRINWVAQPPVHEANNLKLPVPYVIILHTATDNCTDNGKCIKIVRQVQNFHVESNGWWDIAYNFLVGGNGYVYEGRGWKKEGANALGWNNRSIGIAFIGTFQTIVPPKRQMIAYQQLIEEGLREGYITSDYKLFAHRQLSDTQSPGEAFYEVIKTLPHWTEKPDGGN